MSTENKPATAINAQTQLNLAIKNWKMFLDDQGSSIHTVKAFIGDLNLLASYLPPDQKIGAITTRDLNNFLDWMQHKRGVPCSPKTLSRRITSLKAFFRWLAQFGAILVDPAEKVVQKSVRSPLPAVMYPKEMDAVLEAASSYRTKEEPDVRYYGGATQGAQGDVLFVRYANPKYRYKERKIDLTEDWLEAYEEYSKEYDQSEKLFPWSPRRLEYLLQDIGEEIGLENQLSFLMCRWTCALNDLNAGMEPNKVRQKLGISEIQWREVRLKLRRLAGLGDDEEENRELADLEKLDAQG